MNSKKILGVLVSLMIISLVGCLPQQPSLVVPDSDVTVSEATDINLRVLDLAKITKEETKEILGFPLTDIENAKTIGYRYPDKPILVKIVKFESKALGQEFWADWTNFVEKEHVRQIVEKSGVEDNVLEFKTSNSNIIAWQGGLWFTFIEVPGEFENSSELSSHVKDVVMLHYEKLNE